MLREHLRRTTHSARFIRSFAVAMILRLSAGSRGCRWRDSSASRRGSARLALGGQRRDRSRRRDRHHRRQPQRPLGHHPRVVQLL